MSARQAIQLNRLATEAAFLDLNYHPELAPGASMLKYLLPPAGATTLSHFQLLVPDTIVVEENPKSGKFEAWWYFTDSDGRVRCWSAAFFYFIVWCRFDLTGCTLTMPSPSLFGYLTP